MRRNHLLSFLLTFSLSATPFLALNAAPVGKLGTASKTPVFSVDNKVQRLSATVSSAEVEKKITLTNKGGSLLELKVDGTSCGCTQAVLSANKIAPNQNATLTVKVKTGGWGTKTETVTLRTNDPKKPVVILTIQVEMPKTVVPNPQRLTMQTEEGNVVERFATVLMPDKASAIAVSTTKPFVHATLGKIEAIEGGKVQRIDISLTSDAPSGDFTDTVTVQLKGAEVSQIGIAIEGTVEPDISVQPTQLFLNTVPAGSVIWKNIVVQSRIGKPFSVSSLVASTKGVTAKANSQVVASSHAIEVAIMPQGEAGSFVEDTLTITLSNGKTLQIPVVGMIAKANEKMPVTSNATLEVGKVAPDFSIVDMNGNPQTLAERRGKKNLLLTFFPKCFTGGCTNHLSTLRDEYSKFASNDTDVLAVSVDAADGEQGQLAFAAKWGFQFPLVPDTSRKLSMLYGTAQTPTDLSSRMTVLIDKNGVVRWIDRDVNVTTHGADVLKKMRELEMAK